MSDFESGAFNRALPPLRFVIILTDIQTASIRASEFIGGESVLRHRLEDRLSIKHIFSCCQTFESHQARGPLEG